jgi:hypothetical protein
VLNLGTTHINLTNCAYETVIYYPRHIKEMINNHFMTSYYQSLSFLKNSLNEKMETQRKQALFNHDYKTAEQFTYPSNCQKPNVSNLNLEGLELNYQLLKNNLED